MDGQKVWIVFILTIYLTSQIEGLLFPLFWPISEINYPDQTKLEQALISRRYRSDNEPEMKSRNNANNFTFCMYLYKWNLGTIDHEMMTSIKCVEWLMYDS